MFCYWTIEVSDNPNTFVHTMSWSRLVLNNIALGTDIDTIQELVVEPLSKSTWGLDGRYTPFEYPCSVLCIFVEYPLRSVRRSPASSPSIAAHPLCSLMVRYRHQAAWSPFEQFSLPGNSCRQINTNSSTLNIHREESTNRTWHRHRIDQSPNSFQCWRLLGNEHRHIASCTCSLS